MAPDRSDKLDLIGSMMGWPRSSTPWKAMHDADVNTFSWDVGGDRRAGLARRRSLPGVDIQLGRRFASDVVLVACDVLGDSSGVGMLDCRVTS